MKIEPTGRLEGWYKFDHKMIEKKEESIVVGATQKIEGNNIGLITSDGKYKDKLVIFNAHGARTLRHDMLEKDLWLVDPAEIIGVITLGENEAAKNIDEFNETMDNLKQDVISKTETITSPDTVKKYNLKGGSGNGIMQNSVPKIIL